MSLKRALVIDEDVEVRRILSKALVDAGWWVDGVESGLAGLQAIQNARDHGEGFSCIITEAFLPDLDGKPFLKTLRLQYPGVNFVVITGYGGNGRESLVKQLQPALFVKKPADIVALIAALEDLAFETSTAFPAAAPKAVPYEDNIGAYVYLQVDFSQIEETVSALRELRGVSSANAVHGPDFNMILRVALPSIDDLTDLLELAGVVAGVTVLGHDLITVARLGIGVDEFARHYQPVWEAANVDFVAGEDTNAYLFVDIDRYQIERIYMSLLLTTGVIRCRVVNDGNKIILLCSGAIQPNIIRHLLGKLAEMDGVRRVREVKVIRIMR